MVMSVNVAELKAQLSRYLRMASRGARVVVKDRRTPIAELHPPRGGRTRYDQLVAEGKLIPSTRTRSSLRFSSTKGKVDIQAALREVREAVD